MLNLIEQNLFTFIENIRNNPWCPEDLFSTSDYMLELLMAMNNEQDKVVLDSIRKDFYLYLNKHAKEFEE